MSVVRAAQFPFEILFNENNRGLEFAANEAVDNIQWAATEPYTGLYSVKSFGVVRSGWGATIAASDDVRFGFTMRLQGLSSDCDFIQLDKSGQEPPGLRIRWMEDEFRWDLYVDGVKVGEYGMFDTPIFELCQDDTWCSHGFHCIGGSRFVYTINGISVIDYSDAGVPSATEAVWIGDGGWDAYNYIDDLYIDIVAGEAVSVPPTYRFLPSMVDADGGTMDWASSVAPADDYTAVDDAVVDDDATYVYITSTNSPQDFNTAAITLPVDHSIVAAIPFAVARKGNATVDSQLRLRAYDGSYTDGADQNLPTWYTELWERMTTDPSAAAWLEATFNAAEFGFQSRGTV